MVHMMSSSAKETPNNEELLKQLKWVEVKKSEPSIEENKFQSKFLENPFVPIGCVATTMALTYGLYYLKQGNSKKQQEMMRYRVIAQGFTIGALALGLVVVELRKRVNSK